VSAYLIPTDAPESDGTLEWQHTTLVVVEATAGGQKGMGYGYADLGTAHLIKSMLIDVVTGHDAMAVPDCWIAMVQAIRNMGRPGIASMAISVVDMALWGGVIGPPAQSSTDLQEMADEGLLKGTAKAA